MTCYNIYNLHSNGPAHVPHKYIYVYVYVGIDMDMEKKIK